MKTLVVLSALAVAALAGPTIPEDITDFEATKALKRSPTFGKHHTIGIPVHHVPVHHTFVQPVIPHHLGLKKPLHFHHGLHYRAEGEDAEARSMESKETKTKCMKEMEAKCDDEFIAKSSELENTKIEDISEDISESDVAQSLQMAKEAVNTLQKKLMKAEKNPRMSQWKHGESESDLKLHQDIATAKQALDHMQLNFGNVESMNVHTTTFKQSGVQDVHLELSKSEQERLSQWKDAIEDIQKNVELVKNIEDSFQENDNSQMKSVTFGKSTELKKVKSEHESSTSKLAHNKQGFLDKSASEVDMAGKFAVQEKKSDMESSASTMNESKTTFKSLDDHHEQKSRSESSSSQSKQEISQSNQNSVNQKISDAALTPFGVVPVVAGKKMTAQGLQMVGDNEQGSKAPTEKTIGGKQMESASSMKAMKSSENEGTPFTQFHQVKSVPTVDTTALMKSADEHINAEHATTSNSEKAQSSLKNVEKIKSQSHLEQSRSSHLDSSKIMDHKSMDMSSSSIHNKNDHHNVMMKSSDQMTGQSQHSEAVLKEIKHGHHLEKSQLNSFGAHSKSAEGDSLSSQSGFTGLNAGFKSSLDVPKSKSWKEAAWKGGSFKSAYGTGSGLGSGYGIGGGSGGYGAGGAVGVFPNAHVGGCAIPLLLSCSPKVVAGSLAKAHSSYAAPSYAGSGYRSSDNANTHNKRDITKIAMSKAKRTPISNYKPRPTLITDKLF